MKKILLVTMIRIFVLFIALSFSTYYSVYADNPKSDKPMQVIPESEVVYQQIDWGKHKKLNKAVFLLGYQGYLNLKKSGQISANNHLLTICDYSLSANIPRMWVFDLKKKKVIIHSLVAHGQGTGEEYATRFSNVHESHQSSLGFYRTEGTYEGSNGYSMKLTGLDKGFNCNAMDRAIVVHGADYVSNDFIRNNKRLGRSWGCPALPQATAANIINTIKNGSCLFIYHPTPQYLTKSKWLKTNMPMVAAEDNAQADKPKRKLVASVYSFPDVEAKGRYSVPKDNGGSL